MGARLSINLADVLEQDRVKVEFQLQTFLVPGEPVHVEKQAVLSTPTWSRAGGGNEFHFQICLHAGVVSLERDWNPSRRSAEELPDYLEVMHFLHIVGIDYRVVM